MQLQSKKPSVACRSLLSMDFIYKSKRTLWEASCSAVLTTKKAGMQRRTGRLSVTRNAAGPITAGTTVEGHWARTSSRQGHENGMQTLSSWQTTNSWWILTVPGGLATNLRRSPRQLTATPEEVLEDLVGRMFFNWLVVGLCSFGTLSSTIFSKARAGVCCAAYCLAKCCCSRLLSSKWMTQKPSIVIYPCAKICTKDQKKLFYWWFTHACAWNVASSDSLLCTDITISMCAPFHVNYVPSKQTNFFGPSSLSTRQPAPLVAHRHPANENYIVWFKPHMQRTWPVKKLSCYGNWC